MFLPTTNNTEESYMNVEIQPIDDYDIKDVQIQPEPIIINDHSNGHQHQQHSSEYEVKKLIKTEKDVDSMLAQDLNTLSLQDREKVYEEIHGVNSVTEETEALINQSLFHLERAIQRIQDKEAYNLAINKSVQSKNYIESSKFRLMFLRCENFDVDSAASRLVLYLERMLTYFGPDVLGRPLYYSDLNEDSQQYLEAGVHHLVPNERDSSGRALFVNMYLQAANIETSSLSRVQTFIYLFNLAIENDVVIQKRGLVFISYRVGKVPEPKFDTVAWMQIADLQNWFPMKIPAIHVCSSANFAWRVFQPLCWVIMGEHLRRRVRIHDGAHLECLYALQSFGISPDKLPICLITGSLKTTAHTKFLNARKAKEVLMKQSSTPLEVVDDLTDNDVALWRGRIYQLHPGNVRMRELIAESREEYDKATKGPKAEIAMEIVQKIKTQYKGRFLTKDSDGVWIEVPDKEAQRKVSKAFRSARTAAAAATTTTTARSSMSVNINNKRLRIEAPSPSSDLSRPFDEGCCICIADTNFESANGMFHSQP